MTKLLQQSFLAATVFAFPALACAADAVANQLVRLEERVFGQTAEGQKVKLYTLRNANGMTAKIMERGATVTELQAPDREGRFANVVLGADTLDTYLAGYNGSAAVIGRVANRIANARFTLDGKEYQVTANAGKHHIHGGKKNFSNLVWQSERLPTAPRSASVRFSSHSPDGTDGYPGNLDAAVVYTLTDDNELRLDYSASTDKPTLVNLTNHAYFNLAGKGDVFGHLVWIAADRYTLVDADLIPTGEFADVKGTPLDFTKPTTIGARIEQLVPTTKGYDHNYVLRNGGASLALAGWAYEPQSGRLMQVLTDQPGMQLYTGKRYFENGKPVAATAEQKHNTVCFETQHFPDAINHPNFPSVILRPGETFQRATVFRFTTANAAPN